MHKRVIVVVGIEGIDSWVDEVLRKRGRVIFNKQGTIKDILRLELKEDEWVDLTLLRPKKLPLPR